MSRENYDQLFARLVNGRYAEVGKRGTTLSGGEVEAEPSFGIAGPRYEDPGDGGPLTAYLGLEMRGGPQNTDHRLRGEIPLHAAKSLRDELDARIEEAETKLNDD